MFPFVRTTVITALVAFSSVLKFVAAKPRTPTPKSLSTIVSVPRALPMIAGAGALVSSSSTVLLPPTVKLSTTETEKVAEVCPLMNVSRPFVAA